MADLGDDDPLSVAIRRQPLQTATQPGQGALDVQTQFGLPSNTPLMNIRGRTNLATGQTDYRDVTQPNGGDFISQAIARREALAGQLATANRRQATGIIAQIRGIESDLGAEDQQRRFEANQRRLMAHQDATLAEHAIKTDRETSIDEQGAALMTGLGQLDALHRAGHIDDNQYDSNLLDLGQQNLLGLRHPTAAKMYDHFVTEADRRNQFGLRRTTAEATRLAGRYGIDIQTDDNGMPSIEATKAAALQTPKGKSEFLKGLNDEMYQKYNIPLGVGALFNPIVPHTSPDKGATIDLPYIDKKTDGVGKLNVPTPLFNQMKADFQDRYFSAFPEADQGAPQPQGAATAQQGLQTGATRNVGGKNYAWNGTRWEPQ